MTMKEILSKEGIGAISRANEIGKERLGCDYLSSTVTELLRNGFRAKVESKDGRHYVLVVRGQNGLENVSFVQTRRIHERK